MLATLLTSIIREHVALTTFFLFLPLLGRAFERYFRRWRLAQDEDCQQAMSKAFVKDPIIGLDFLYDICFGRPPARYLDSTYKSFQQLGPTYTVERWTWTSIYTCDPHNIKHILASRAEDFGLPEIRISIMDKLFGKGIFSLTGHPWAHSRTVIRQGFRKQDPVSFIEILERHFQAFVKNISTDGTQVDLQPLFLGLTMDIATEFLMGQSTHMLDASEDHSKEQRFVEDYIMCSTEFVEQMQLGPLHHFKLNSEVKRAKQRMLTYVDAFIDQALQHPQAATRGSSLLHDLVAMSEDRKALRAQVLHILLASRDTTAGLLSNLFFMLAKSPEIYAKLREDVLRVCGDEAPTAAQLKEMAYLKWCVNESLRLHPVIPSNAREALRDTTLPRGGGKDGMAPLFVPKGAIIIYAVYAMHRNGEIFGAEPEEFEPERWDGLRPGWGYLPFNGGKRTCLGQQYALLESYYIVARMTQTYKTLESRDEADWAELYALAMCSKNGTKVAVTG
ncbi:Fc.00g044300.m01.CDS01 [Cosmosporella sp. VM-42]